MGLLKIINNKVDNHFDKKWSIEPMLELDPNIYKVFKEHGEGIYYSNIISENNDWVSKGISLISGKYSHSMIILYTENIKELLNEQEYERLISKFKIYYGDSNELKNFVNNTKVFVLGSADNNGMNYLNFSHYQDRRQIISSTPFKSGFISNIVSFMFYNSTMNKNYDYTGLLFWWLWRALDDERSWYCSEQVYDVFKIFGYKVAKRKNPSPTQIAKYSERVLKNIIYDSR